MSPGLSLTAPPRFTRYGSDELEHQLNSACERVAQGVRGIVPPAQLDGLLLAGGYGCGEGGVQATPEGERASGPFDFLLLVHEDVEAAAQDLAPELADLGRQLREDTGAKGIFRISSRERVARSVTTPALHDLAHGHRRLIGALSLSSAWEHHREAAAISLHQVTQWLCQRCSGLLLAAQRLQGEEFTSEDADRIHRRLSRMELVFGDAVLAAHGEYHWSCTERHRRLGVLRPAEPIPNLALMYEMHAWGVAAQLRPTQALGTRESLQRRLNTLVSVARDLWLWQEGRRLGQKFRMAEDYASSPVNKCPEASPWSSAVLSWRLLGLPALFTGRLAHPRQRLFHALALLLWEPALFNTPRLREHLARELQRPARNFSEATEAYAALWKKCDEATSPVIVASRG